MTTYTTVVTELPPTPRGLLPARWTIEHHCRTCRQTIPTDEALNNELLGHTRTHHTTTITDRQEGDTID